jgi:hypothetical protein
VVGTAVEAAVDGTAVATDPPAEEAGALPVVVGAADDGDAAGAVAVLVPQPTVMLARMRLSMTGRYRMTGSFVGGPESSR